MSNLDHLRTLMAHLQDTYDKTHSQLASEFEEPLLVRTVGGRFVLLDALTALVDVATVLARAETRVCGEHILAMMPGDHDHYCDQTVEHTDGPGVAEHRCWLCGMKWIKANRQDPSSEGERP